MTSPLKRLPPRRKPAKRYSLEDRELILDRFEARYATGLPSDEAAVGLGASMASIKRWRRGRDPMRGRIPPTLAQASSIDAAIIRLCDKSNLDQVSFLESLFKLMAWLRWPNKPHDHPAAIMVCVVNYLHQLNPMGTIDQIEPKYRELLFRHVRLDTLSLICSDDVFSLPSFLQWKHDEQPYTDLDWMAMVVWFLLAYEPRSDRQRDALSLGKAYFATQNGVFPYKWPIALRTFKSYWSISGAAAPFQYVERFHLGEEFTLDPSSSHFAESVNDLMKQPAEIRRYLARARWVIETLSARLDKRSLDALRFPSFPTSLEAEPVAISALSPETSRIMARYRSA